MSNGGRNSKEDAAEEYAGIGLRKRVYCSVKYHAFLEGYKLGRREAINEIPTNLKEAAELKEKIKRLEDEINKLKGDN